MRCGGWTSPDAETFRKSVWGPVLVRLGRVPRAEGEDLLDRLGDSEFSATVRGTSTAPIRGSKAGRSTAPRAPG